MTDDPLLLWLGMVLCAAAVAVGLLAPQRRARLAGFTVALLAAPILMVGDNWGTEQVLELRDRPFLALAALSGAIGMVLVLGLVLHRLPRLVPPLLIAALPFRVPVDLGGAGEPANLLLPLYVLIAAALVAAWLEPGDDAAPLSRLEGGSGWLRWTAGALAAVVGVYALQGFYAADASPAAEVIAFFLAPFGALFFLLSEARWDGAAMRAVVLVLAVEGLLFAAVGFVQYVSGDLFWNDKVIAGNEAHAYFRVNSLFWDPNILGRYLAVTMVVLAAVVAFARERRQLMLAAGAFAVLVPALVASFSQSGTIALLAGIVVLAAARFGIATGLAAAAAVALAALASLALIDGGGLAEESSGRAGLIDGGLEIAADAPVAGEGSGTFTAEFTERFGGGLGTTAESHTEPVTVLAEQGGLGLIVYGALLLVTVGGLILAVAPRWRAPAAGPPVAAALLAAYAAMIVHSLGYAAFLTDPITWAVLAIATAVLVPLPEARGAPAADPRPA